MTKNILRFTFLNLHKQQIVNHNIAKIVKIDLSVKKVHDNSIIRQLPLFISTLIVRVTISDLTQQTPAFFPPSGVNRTSFFQLAFVSISDSTADFIDFVKYSVSEREIKEIVKSAFAVWNARLNVNI